MQLLSAWTEQSLPFVALLALMLVLRNVLSLVQLAFLVTSTASSTLHLQALVAAPPERLPFKIVDVLLIVSINIWALSFLGVPDPVSSRAMHLRVPLHGLSVRRVRVRSPRSCRRTSPELLAIDARRCHFERSRCVPSGHCRTSRCLLTVQAATDCSISRARSSASAYFMRS